jgi:transcriptional regulator with XRE-family HTH domain
MKIRLHLKVARIAKGLSQSEVSEIVGVSQQTIAKWERGVTTPSQFSHLRALENALDEPADVLFPDIFSADPCLAECE